MKQDDGSLYDYISNCTFLQVDVLGLKPTEINSRSSIVYTGIKYRKSVNYRGNTYSGNIGQCPKCKCAFIWIHGYNVDEASAIQQGEDINDSYKESGGKCDVYNFIWNGNPGLTQFHASMKAARMVGPGSFSTFIRDFQNKCPDTKLHVGAHSLGSAVILSALKKGTGISKIGHVFLINSAVDNESIAKGEEFSEASSLAESIQIAYSRRDIVLFVPFSLASSNAALGNRGLDKSGEYSENIYQKDYTYKFGYKHSAVYDENRNFSLWNDIAIKTK